MNDQPTATRRLRPRRAAGIVVGMFVLVASVILSLVFSADGPGSSIGRVDRSVTGTRAPTFMLPGLSSETVLSSDFAGHVTVINFWASWCVPCRDEVPVLVGLVRSWRGKGVRFVGIVENDTASAARSFQRRHRVTWPSAIDGDRAVADNFGVRGIPETYVIGRDGRLVAKVLGRLHEGQLDAVIADARAERFRPQSGQ